MTWFLVYTLKKYRKTKDNTNNDAVSNLVAREFDHRKEFEVIVSDLTYVRVGNNWNYICVLLFI